jgi:hypothetical protein
MADAVSVFYNYTGDKPCFNYTQGVNPSTQEDGDMWGYQYCTEMFMPMVRMDGALLCGSWARSMTQEKRN